MKKKKILLVSEYFYPHWTGIAQSFLCLAKNLVEQGYTVTILTTQFDKNLKREEMIGKLKVIREPYSFMVSRTHYSYMVIFKFAKILHKYDTVLINSPNSNILWYSLLAKFKRKRLVVYNQADLSFHGMAGKLVEGVFLVSTFLSMILADKVSTFTRDYAVNSRFMKYFLGKFKPYIPDYQLPSGKPSRKLLRKLKGIRKQDLLIGFVGRFVEEKGIDILLKAIPMVVEKYPKARFVFAGETNIKYENFYERSKKLLEKNKKYLVFLGLLNAIDLNFYYNYLSVFVLCSRAECFALTQLEAVQNKVPIVVTDVPGARVLVRESGFGVIVKPEDPESLAKGIIEVIKNRSKYVKNSGKVNKFLKKYQNFNVGGEFLQ